ncbi:hypothetical protein KJ819_02730 [Patescibacteria group bacterium]|nr:hypothetical protein [Patescibacteria group bacterium]MBU1500805.1 hypothetical protein [Patescibacteria group bacterium]MBU2080860.1 hypothetical protein [Patescibacteria group bacterium]MBU2123965.1 hypothetical protein [Patescibacteria group bacterium]MBU2194744.1 hypothetical protein [Patescibacteria group bacterium]
MNIEDLSKTQLLLLTILVNFVTAIATAVMTVSLLDQAPPTVTQTVNRIVERTVEQAAQAAPIPGIVTKETTVVIKNEDLMAAAISANAARTVYIRKGATTTPVLAVGTYLSNSRAVVTATAVGLPKEATISFPDGTTVEASLSKPGATLTVYGFSDSQVLPSGPVPDLIPSAELKQGQTLIALTRDNSAITGIISKIDADGIRSNVTGVPAGAAAVNISGDVIGIATSVPGLFAPADKISTLLTAEDL